MDLAQIHEALLSTMSPNKQQREAAEGALKGASSSPGYLTALFTIVSSADTKVEVRQAGAIYFKNLVLKHWENSLNPGEEPVRGAPAILNHPQPSPGALDITTSAHTPSHEPCGGAPGCLADVCLLDDGFRGVSLHSPPPSPLSPYKRETMDTLQYVALADMLFPT